MKKVTPRAPTSNSKVLQEPFPGAWQGGLDNMKYKLPGTMPPQPAKLAFSVTASAIKQVGQSYLQTNVASGGTAPYRYSVFSGKLPSGVTIDGSTGTVSGTPSLAGSFHYSIKAIDSSRPIPQTVTHSLSGSITSYVPPTLSLNSISSVVKTVGQSYLQTNAASGGTAPYIYSVSSGTLVTGTTLNSATGTVSGTPSDSGAFNYTIMVTDSGIPTPQTVTRTITGTIASASPTTLTLTSIASSTMQVGQNYSQTNVASGGTASYTYSVFSGTLPTGTTLNTSTGTVFGTPSVSGSFSYTVKVTDSGSPTVQTATNTLSGTIADVSPPPGPVGTVTLGTLYATDAAGWSVITPRYNADNPTDAATNSNIIYVSSSTGNDSNPGTLASPIQTLVTARTTGSGKGTLGTGIRDGFPDWILLLKGDTFTEAGTPLFMLISGASADEPIVLASYTVAGAIQTNPRGTGTGDRPIIVPGSGAIASGFSATDCDFLAVIGLEMQGSAGNVGIGLSAPISWGLIEDCKVSGFDTGFQVNKSTGGSTLPNDSNFIIRRNVVVDCRNTGVFAAVEGFIFQENIIDNSGVGGPSVQKHNFYFQGITQPGDPTTASTPVNISGNIFSRDPAGSQARANGTISNNLWTLNPYPHNFANPANAATVVDSNVYLEGTDGTGLGGGYGAGPQNFTIYAGDYFNLGTQQFTNNIIANSQVPAQNNALYMLPGTNAATITNNIVYKWGGTNATDGTGTFQFHIGSVLTWHVNAGGSSYVDRTLTTTGTSSGNYGWIRVSVADATIFNGQERVIVTGITGVANNSEWTIQRIYSGSTDFELIGSTYTSGSSGGTVYCPYHRVPLSTNISGSGTGAIADILTQGGVVKTVTFAGTDRLDVAGPKPGDFGSGYVNGNVISAPNNSGDDGFNSSGAGSGFQLTVDTIAVNTISSNKFDVAGTNSFGFSHPDPTASGSTSLVGDYYHSIGGTSSELDFLAAAALQSKDNWNPALTANAVNTYIRTGFGL